MRAPRSPTARKFYFRPAYLKRPELWVLDTGDLKGPGGKLALDDVREVAVVQRRRGGLRTLRFDLMTGVRTARIQVTASARRDPPSRDVDRFLALCIAVGEELAARKPDLTYRMEESGKARFFVFAVGTIALLFVLGAAGLLVAGKLTLSPVWVMGLSAILGFMALGAILLLTRKSGRTRPGQHPIASLPFVLSAMGSGTGTPASPSPGDR